MERQNQSSDNQSKKCIFFKNSASILLNVVLFIQRSNRYITLQVQFTSIMNPTAITLVHMYRLNWIFIRLSLLKRWFIRSVHIFKFAFTDISFKHSKTILAWIFFLQFLIFYSILQFRPCFSSIAHSFVLSALSILTVWTLRSSLLLQFIKK